MLEQDLPSIAPRLVAVSKTKPKDVVIQAYEAGQRSFGENYVKEILEKGHDEEVLAKCPEIKWHFIGHLQSNKINKLITVPNLHIIETIDSLKLATAVNNAWVRSHPAGEKLNIFLQVNTSGEKGKSDVRWKTGETLSVLEKSGCKPEETPELSKSIQRDCPGLNVLGLMTIGAYDNYDQQIGINPDFKSLRDCRQPVADALGVQPESIELSMGMSGDFEHAVRI